MKILAGVLALAAPLLAGACNTVSSRAPVGATPLVLEDEDWNGTWVAGNGSLVTVRVRDGQAGWLEMAVTEDEGERLVPHVLQVRLREHDDCVYASVEGDSLDDASSDLDGLHLWARVRREEEQLIFWLPDAGAFAGLVDRGELPGSVSGGDVVLEALEGEALAALQGEPAWRLFHWDEPLALIRLAPAR